MNNCNSLEKKNKHTNDKNIILYGKKHIYYIKNSKQKYLSVTNIIDYFFPETEFNDFRINFNKTNKGGHKNIKNTIKRKKKSKKILEKKYEIEGFKGRKIHNDIDKYLNGCEITNKSKEFSQFKSFLNNNPELEIYRTEWLIYSKKYKIVGIVDAIFRNKKTGEFYLYDWKRIKNIYTNPNFFYNYGYYPISNIPNLNGYHYFLQLNFYKMILKEYDIHISNMYICQFHPHLDNYKIVKSYNLTNDIFKLIRYIEKHNYLLKKENRKDKEEKIEFNFIKFLGKLF